jgi:tetratricopeptide (TPR) repeat protein
MIPASYDRRARPSAIRGAISRAASLAFLICSVLLGTAFAQQPPPPDKIERETADPFEDAYRIRVPDIFAPRKEKPAPNRTPGVPLEPLAAAKELIAEGDDLKSDGARKSLEAAAAKYEEGLTLLGKIQTRAAGEETAEALIRLAEVADALGDRDRALKAYRQSIPLWRNSKNRRREAETLARIGGVHNARGEKTEARAAYDQARLILKTMTLLNASSESTQKSGTIFSLGKVYEDEGDFDQAVEYYQRAIRASQEVGD